MAATTTIAVSPVLRDRINRDAGAHGLTAAGFLERLLDAYERTEMLDSFGTAFAAAGPDYRAELSWWSGLELDLLRD
ncbi:toxin-antitoxin system protein [Nocardioides jejuensis]|uniref:Toxin-antitoxin system protein n=1 Tax=Nocardioides jejuensis TaxID=2502782 RepID=A0A4R1CEC5_9ACTN|nr:toxin-antitoxin system protein [Nocardioides jejuensis]TCJ29409.1 toxin-antitoxin system protein [Nocardioides jejuensis]